MTDAGNTPPSQPSQDGRNKAALIIVGFVIFMFVSILLKIMFYGP